MRLLRIRPIRTVLKWQLIVTAALAPVAWLVTGTHGAVSAVLGGLVAFAAVVVSAAVASLGSGSSAGAALVAVLRAEAAKVGLVVLALWLVLTTYKDVAVVWFIGSFLATILILAAAPAVSDR